MNGAAARRSRGPPATGPSVGAASAAERAARGRRRGPPARSTPPAIAWPPSGRRPPSAATWPPTGRRWPAGPRAEAPAGGGQQADACGRGRRRPASGRARRVEALDRRLRATRASRCAPGRPVATPWSRRRQRPRRHDVARSPHAGRARAELRGSHAHGRGPPRRRRLRWPRHLDATRFEQWLLDEAARTPRRRRHRAAPSTLSGGSTRSRSTAAGSFVVVDHRNADEVRSARTLSGGETFLASLALALALADRIATLAAARRRPARVDLPRRGLRHARPRHARRRGHAPSRSWAPPAGWSASSPTSPSWPSGCPCASRSATVGQRRRPSTRVDR